MPRKKVSTAENMPPSGVDLDDDEQFVKEVTTTTKIAREKKKPAEDFIDAEIIDPDDADELPQFEEGSIASLIYESDDEADISEQFCSVIPRRLKDAMGDKFAKPCVEMQTLETLAGVPLVATREEIQDRVRREHGSGGRFSFQVRFANRLQRSWQAVLADPAGAAAAQATDAGGGIQERPAAASEAANPIDAWLADLKRQKDLRDALFGDSEAGYKAAIARLETEISELRKANPHEPQSEKLALLSAALDAKDDGPRDRILNHLFPSDEPEKRHWIPDAIDVVLQHKDAIMSVVGSLLGGGIRPPANGGVSIDEMMRQPAPASALPTPAEPVGFQRKAMPTTTVAAGEAPDDAVTSETVIDGDDVKDGASE